MEMVWDYYVKNVLIENWAYRNNLFIQYEQHYGASLLIGGALDKRQSEGGRPHEY